MKLMKSMNILGAVIVLTACFVSGAQAISQDTIDGIENSIVELQDKQDTAKLMADSARKLGLSEDSPTIETAKSIWIDTDTEKQRLHEELEVARRKLKEINTRVYAGTFRLTGYCPCSSCSGPWGYSTSSGARATEGITVAADPNVLPEGTKLYIEGVGTRVVQDVGGAVRGNKIDIFVSSHGSCYDSNINCMAKVYILE